jgi:hypothetical protein
MKVITVTHTSPLPLGITPQAVLDFLHTSAEELIDLTPSVKECHPILPPGHIPPDEQQFKWWSITETVSYLPGNIAMGDQTYLTGFFNLPNGMTSHVIASLGTDIWDRWTLQQGSLSSESTHPGAMSTRNQTHGLFIRVVSPPVTRTTSHSTDNYDQG